MTRKALARHAIVLRLQDLAQLEAGGNGSSTSCAGSRAIGLPVTQLVHEGSEPALDLALLTQFSSASPANLVGGARPFAAPFSAATGRRAPPSPRADRAARRRQVDARQVRRRASRPALHRALPRDREAQRRHPERDLRHVRPGDLSARRGEVLDDALRRQKGFVVATSGSIVTEPGTLELLLASCFTVWVKAAPEEHMKRVMAQGDMRPMANSARAMEDLVSILRSREPLTPRPTSRLSPAAARRSRTWRNLLRLIEVPDSRISAAAQRLPHIG